MTKFSEHYLRHKRAAINSAKKGVDNISVQVAKGAQRSDTSNKPKDGENISTDGDLKIIREEKPFPYAKTEEVKDAPINSKGSLKIIPPKDTFKLSSDYEPEVKTLTPAEARKLDNEERDKELEKLPYYKNINSWDPDDKFESSSSTKSTTPATSATVADEADTYVAQKTETTKSDTTTVHDGDSFVSSSNPNKIDRTELQKKIFRSILPMIKFNSEK